MSSLPPDAFRIEWQAKLDAGVATFELAAQ